VVPKNFVFENWQLPRSEVRVVLVRHDDRLLDLLGQPRASLKLSLLR